MSALRSALAAVDNAGSVDIARDPSAHFEYIAGSIVGLGAGELPRRYLSAADVAAIVTAEAAGRDEAAVHHDALGRPDEAGRLRAESAVLRELLGTG